MVKLSAAFKDSEILNHLYLPEADLAINEQSKQLILDENKNLNSLTKQMIVQVLQEENGNIARTAKRLNISRTTIYKYIGN